jgi:outer membrane receptor protein involved in Fe transport
MFKDYLSGISAVVALTLMAGGAAQAEAAADADIPIEEIIVKGEKRAKSLQETVSSVRVITPDAIDNENIDNVYDVFARTVNVSEANSGNGFTIRGIDAFSVSGGGTSFLASVYVDGAALPHRAVANGPLTMWDMGQVEILRGPQSTLQGRNALAGAIVIRTQDPTYEWDAKAQVTIGNYGQEEYAIAAGGPIVEDQVAFRVSAEKTDFDGYVHNTTLDTPSDYNEDETYRAKLLLEPEGLPGFRAILTASHNDNEMGIRGHLVQPDGADYDERFTVYDHPTYWRNKTDILTAELSLDLSDVWSLYSVSSYNKNLYTYEWDSDTTAEPLGTLYDYFPTKTFTQELRANFEYDNFKGLIGGYFSDVESTDSYGGITFITLERLGLPQLLVAPPEFGGLGLPQELASAVLSLYAPADPVAIAYDTVAPQNVSSYALFGDATYDLTDKFSVFAGFRFDHEKQETAYSNAPIIANEADLPDPTNPLFDPFTAQVVAGINAVLYGQLASASADAPLADASFDAFLPKFGMTYRWTDDLSTSVTVQKGHRSGGVGQNIGRARVYTYEPEETWNYEFSLRSQWLDGRLTVNANAFYIDWTDQQISVQLSASDYDAETRNAGSSHLYGFELETFYQPSADLNFYAGLGHVRTEFDEFLVETPTQTYDLSGREFADAPRWSANAGFTYSPERGFFLNLNANYNSKSHSVINPATIAGLDPIRGSRTLVNGKIGYQTDNYGLYLYGNNLFNENYLVSPDQGQGFEQLGAPRTYGVILQVKL